MTERSIAPADKRKRILEAAIRVFAEHGYHGTTTRELAQRSGLSVPGVYHYYPSKQDILFDLMTVIIDERSGDLLSDAIREHPEARTLNVHAQLLDRLTAA